MRVDGDTLRIDELKYDGFFFGVERNYYLGKDLDGVKISGWALTQYCECDIDGIVNKISLLNTTYHDINAKINNSSMQFDGPGFMILYDRSKGFIRSSQVHWWSQSGEGWDLIPTK